MTVRATLTADGLEGISGRGARIATGGRNIAPLKAHHRLSLSQARTITKLDASAKCGPVDL
jgi:hypothetical protein